MSLSQNTAAELATRVLQSVLENNGVKLVGPTGAAGKPEDLAKHDAAYLVELYSKIHEVIMKSNDQ